MKKKCFGCGLDAWFVFLLIWCLCPGLEAKDPEIFTSLAPHFLFEGSKIPLEIKYSGSNRFRWEFGDGQVRMGTRKQTHIYKSRGLYKIKVIDLEDKKKDPLEKKITILKEGREIILENKTFYPGTEVKLKVRKFVQPSVQWNFGDGTVKTGGISMIHSYKRGGTFKVKVKDYGGQGVKEIERDITIKTDPRSIKIPTEILMGEPVEFLLQQAGGGQYTWEFSDGQRGIGTSIKNIRFKRMGNTTLTIKDKSGSYPPITQSFLVKRDDRDIKSSLTFALPEEEIIFETERFRGRKVKWDFGDGIVKSLKAGRIKHIFKRTGRYRVTAKDFDGKSKREFSKMVTVGDQTPNFQINVMELAFNNGKYYQVASFKSPPPSYYLKINASGRGILKGSWVLDGQVIGLFQVLLKDGKIAQLKGNDVQRLPLKDQGKHRLTIAFNNYKFNQRIPILRYFITDSSIIEIKYPHPGEKINKKSGIQMQWGLKEKQGEPTFQIFVSQVPPQFLMDEKMQWQPVGKTMSFELDTDSFKPGSWIYWQVRVVDRDGKVLTISEIASFKYNIQ
jgi:PKD repeat protein